MVDKLSMVLFERQADMITPEASLGQNDFCDVLEAAKHDITPDAQQDNRGSGAYENYPPTIGRSEVEISMMFALYSRGSGGDPDFVRVLECAGWERRLDNPNIIMRPRNEIIHAGTLWGYYGGPGTNKSLLEKYGNIMFDGSITLEAGKRGTLSVTGKGKYVSPPARATQPSVGGMREREVAPPILSATVSINGQSYSFVKAEVTFGQSIENNVDATDTYGGGDTEITERNIEWSATVYMKANTSLIPHTNLFANTTGSLDFQWGTKYGAPDLQLYSPYATITDVKRSENNGVMTWELKGVIERNDIELRIFRSTTSSYSSTSASISSDSNSSSSASSVSDSVSSSSTSVA